MPMPPTFRFVRLDDNPSPCPPELQPQVLHSAHTKLHLEVRQVSHASLEHPRSLSLNTYSLAQ